MNAHRFSLLAVAASLGCYSYVPASLETVPLQSEVNTVLSTEGQIDLRNRIGLDTRELKGQLVSRSADSVLIAVPVTGPFTSTTGERLRQRIDLARADLLEVEVRQQSTPKTAALVFGSLGAGIAAIIITATADSNPGSDNPQTPGPQERLDQRFPFRVGIP